MPLVAAGPPGPWAGAARSGRRTLAVAAAAAAWRQASGSRRGTGPNLTRRAPFPFRVTADGRHLADRSEPRRPGRLAVL